jgi:hypothetical protein
MINFPFKFNPIPYAMPSLHVFRTNSTTGKEMQLAQQSEARAAAGCQKIFILLFPVTKAFVWLPGFQNIFDS